MINFKIDEIIPCIKKVETGEIYDTEVVRIKRKSFLAKYNSKTGWYVNWANFSNETEIYALVLKGTMDIQGMVAIQYDDSSKAVYVVWGCTAPQNNIWRNGIQEFSGVGGHLMAIASELSTQHGYEGYIYADAVDKELFDYYCNNYGATSLSSKEYPFRFMLTDETTIKLREVYNYEWTDEII